MKRSTLIPLFLLLYLCFMAIYFGYPSYLEGNVSLTDLVGISGTTLFAIVMLHFSLKKRERLRRERENDMRNK